MLPGATLSHAGGSVHVEVRAGYGSSFEIVPAQQLAPRTEYELTVTWRVPERVLLRRRAPPGRA